MWQEVCNGKVFFFNFIHPRLYIFVPFIFLYLQQLAKKKKNIISWSYCYFRRATLLKVGPVAQSVQRLATGWRSGDLIPAGGEKPVQTGPGAHPASCTMGTGSFPGVKSGRGVRLTPHSLLAPWSTKSRAIPLLPLWAVRPILSLSACIRVHFTFTFTN